jgi:hypothetical protein
MPQGNQHKPLRVCNSNVTSNQICSNIYLLAAPLDEICPHILNYWNMWLSDVDILCRLQDRHIDTEMHGIAYIFHSHLY